MVRAFTTKPEAWRFSVNCCCVHWVRQFTHKLVVVAGAAGTDWQPCFRQSTPGQLQRSKEAEWKQLWASGKLLQDTNEPHAFFFSLSTVNAYAAFPKLRIPQLSTLTSSCRSPLPATTPRPASFRPSSEIKCFHNFNHLRQSPERSLLAWSKVHIFSGLFLSWCTWIEPLPIVRS